MGNMFYQEFNPTGQKAAILLHGLGASSDSWQLQWPALVEAGYRVIVPDMLGFGKSSYKNKKNTMNSMADDVKELMDRLSIPKASFIGLSMGGAIAQVFALNHSEMVEKMVLANTAARFVSDQRKIPLSRVIKRIFVMALLPRRFGAQMVAEFTFPRPGQEQYRKEFFQQIMMSSRRAYFHAVKSIISHDVREQLRAVNTPTLIIGGEHDYITPAFQQKILNENIKGSKLVIIEGAGHASSVDSATAFNKEMLDFLG